MANEEMWLSQTGGTVNVRNSELHNAAMLGGGELYINGSTLQSDFSGTDCLYVGGGEAVLTNMVVSATRQVTENAGEYTVLHSAISTGGKGKVTLNHSPVYGSILVEADVTLELGEGSNVESEADNAITVKGKADITGCTVRGKQIGLLVTGGKKRLRCCIPVRCPERRLACSSMAAASRWRAARSMAHSAAFMSAARPRARSKSAAARLTRTIQPFLQSRAALFLFRRHVYSGQNALAAGEAR